MSKKRRKNDSPAPVEEVTPVETEVVAEAETIEATEAVEIPVESVEEEVPAEPETISEEQLIESLESAETEEPVAAIEEAPADPAEEPDLRYQLKQVLEAVMFASQKPLSVKEITSILKGAAEADKENPNSVAMPFAKVKEAQLRAAIEELELDYATSIRSYEVRESAAGWQLVTKPDYAPWLRQLFPENRSARLSAPAMETLAIIAYRQPITRADIEAVRGVAVDGVMQTLLDRGLIKIDGRAEIPGRPLLYGTTQNFMEHFGLKNLDDLPNAGELRKISLPTAEPPPAEAPAETQAVAPESPEGTPAEAPAEAPVEASAEESTAEAQAEAILEESPTPAENPASEEVAAVEETTSPEEEPESPVQS